MLMTAYGEKFAEVGRLSEQGGTLRVLRALQHVLFVEMEGKIGVPHVQVMTTLVDTCMQGLDRKVTIYQDLTRVADYNMDAQRHVSTWALSRSTGVDRLHFAINAKNIISSIRSVVIALPIRAYMYRDRAGLDAAVERALSAA